MSEITQSEMTQLGKRLSWSAVLIALTAYTIFFSPCWFFICVVEAFLLMGLWEYFSLAERKGFFINRYLGLTFGALLPIPFYLHGDVLVLTVALLCIFIFNFQKSFHDHAIIGTALTFFGIVYVAWFFSFFAKIRAFEHGPSWIFYILLTVKGGDAAAYFIGKRFGVSKLAVHISPNKSVEGAIGALAGTFLFSIFSKIYLPHVGWIHLAALGLVVGVLSQLGDLAESLLKRDAGVKDSGYIPGLGGILDIIDSLLFVIPTIYYYVALTEGLA